MSVSGIVITLGADEQHAESALKAMQKEQEWLELGERSGLRVPAVVEAPNDPAAEERVRMLLQLPGVALVDVVFVGFEDPTLAPASEVSSDPS